MLERTTAELPLDHLPPEMRTTIVEMQVRLRMTSLRTQQNVSAEIILADAERAGCIYTSETEHEIRVIEIVVDYRYRGKGIAASAIRQVADGAAGKPLRLHVDVTNERAHRLYERLGFRRIGGDEVQHEMELASRP
jgi:ribosomal protein S18 acetylase RimI-like enzyme